MSVMVLRALIVMLITGLLFGYDPGLTELFEMPWRLTWISVLLTLLVLGLVLDTMRVQQRQRAAMERERDAEKKS
jgi:uncharacterized Tic20 family protein